MAVMFAVLFQAYQACFSEKEAESLLQDIMVIKSTCINTLRPRGNGRHFADDNFKCISLNENFEFWIKLHWNRFFIV